MTDSLSYDRKCHIKGLYTYLNDYQRFNYQSSLSAYNTVTQQRKYSILLAKAYGTMFADLYNKLQAGFFFAQELTALEPTCAWNWSCSWTSCRPTSATLGSQYSST